MKFLFNVFLIIGMISGSSAFVAADDNDMEKAEPIEIRATRSKVKPENQTTSFTVITQEEIAKKQHMQVKDILREQLGINVVQTGPLGGTTTVFMRGANSQSTMVMIDGIQFKLNSTGGHNFGHIQLDNVERIEILRGPQSPLWGADAVGGVINIITKKGKGDPTHSLAFEGGSFETFKETLTSRGAFGSFDYSLSFSNTDSDGFSAFSERRGGLENDSYSNKTFSTRAGYNFAGDGRIEFLGRYIRSRNSFDGFNPLTFTFSDTLPEHSVTDDGFAALPLQKSITPWWDIKLTPSVTVNEADNVNPTFGNSFIVNRTYTVDLQNNLEFGDYFSSVVGFEHQATNAANNSAGINFQNENQGYYLFGQFNYKDRFLLSAGGRRDVNTRFDNKTTYKVEAMYRFINWGTKIRAGHATGFRAPSANEILFPFFGNPNIKPEETKSFEIGIEQALFSNQVTFGLTYFNMDLKNQIQFSPVTLIAENIGRARSEGIESFIKWQILENLDINATHTWNQADDTIKKVTLVRRPRNTASISIHHNWRSKLDTLIGMDYRGDMTSGSGRVGGRTLLRAALSYAINKKLKISARGENLLDKEYEESLFFGAPGQAGYLGFTYTFN